MNPVSVTVDNCAVCLSPASLVLTRKQAKEGKWKFDHGDHTRIIFFDETGKITGERIKRDRKRVRKVEEWF